MNTERLNKSKNKKSAVIRLKIESYNYIKETGKISNRNISGQTEWMVRVITMLLELHPDIYTEISKKLNFID